MTGTIPQWRAHPPLRLRVLNAAGRTAQRLGLGRAPLDAASLIEAAHKATGLEDFGPDHFRIGLRTLIDSLEDESRLSPLGCVGRIYSHFGMELTDEAQARMGKFMAENRREKHGVHRYRLEMFGIDAAEASDRFAGYCRRFDVKRRSGPRG